MHMSLYIYIYIYTYIYIIPSLAHQNKACLQHLAEASCSPFLPSLNVVLQASASTSPWADVLHNYRRSAAQTTVYR